MFCKAVLQSVPSFYLFALKSTDLLLEVICDLLGQCEIALVRCNILIH